MSPYVEERLGPESASKPRAENHSEVFAFDKDVFFDDDFIAWEINLCK
ncbi:hypothetical protein PUN28_008664 [Cardiocondyla obscurior]|uniref:Uncharacterized protein n=1 Tax=Cardiocondyla obscurior TaxID=286306 RepID=A0AAW2G4M5_9HYME